MTEMLTKAIGYPGFSFIHCLSVCVTYQGREFQERLDRETHFLPENYDPTDEESAFQIARKDPWALGVIFERKGKSHA